MAMTGRINSVIFYKEKLSLLTSCVWKVNTCAVQRACPSSLCKLPFITRAYYGDINFFGGPSATSVKSSAKLRQLEEENEDAMFVIVSDVWLDNIEVVEKLSLMFSGVFLYLQRLHFNLTHKLSALSDKRKWLTPPPAFFFQVMPPCLQLVLSFVVTSHLPRMEMHKLNRSKVVISLQIWNLCWMQETQNNYFFSFARVLEGSCWCHMCPSQHPQWVGLSKVIAGISSMNCP